MALALPPSEQLKEIRNRLGITTRDVAEFSHRIAQARSRKPNRRSGRVARTLSQRMLYWKRDRYVIGSVGQEVEGDDAEDGGGEEGAGGDEEEGGLGAEGGGGELAELRVAAPGAESGGDTDDKGGEGE